MQFREITKADDSCMAEIVRYNLKNNGLAIPGTVYFDKELNELSRFYLAKPDKRRYYVVLDEDGNVSGGLGFAEVDDIDGCAEMQKLYFDDHIKGRGISRELMTFVEGKAKELGYNKLYLETHSNLKAAVSLYKKMGYLEIPKPDFVVHGAMNMFFMKEI